MPAGASSREHWSALMRLFFRPVILAGALVAGMLAAVPVGVAIATATPAAAATSLCPDADTATFGPNVCVFNDTMSQPAIQADLDAISAQQVPVGSQFDSQRYSPLLGRDRVEVGLDRRL